MSSQQLKQINVSDEHRGSNILIKPPSNKMKKAKLVDEILRLDGEISFMRNRLDLAVNELLKLNPSKKELEPLINNNNNGYYKITI